MSSAPGLAVAENGAGSGSGAGSGGGAAAAGAAFGCNASGLRSQMSRCAKGISIPSSAKRRGDLVVDLAADAEDEVHVAQDHPDLEIEAVRAETGKDHRRRRVQHHQRLVLGDLQQDLLDLAGVGAVGHPHLDDQPPGQVEPRPVGHHPGDQIRVRHDHVGPVEGLDPGRAHRDRAHRAHHAADLDPVALADRAFDQQDDARDEVRHDVLKPEADADRQRAGDDGKARQVDPGRRDGDHRGQEDADVAGARRPSRSGRPGRDWSWAGATISTPPAPAA